MEALPTAGRSRARLARLLASLRPAGTWRIVLFLVLARGRRVALELLGRRTGEREPSTEGETFLRSPRAPSDDRPFPNRIYQTWKSKDRLPANYRAWSRTFRELNPTFEFVLWDDEDNRKFVETRYPTFLPIYDAYPREIYRVDAVRYLFLFHYGGLYADMDCQCLLPLESTFRDADVWLGRMGQDLGFRHSIPNAIMASTPRQEFWLWVVHCLIQRAAVGAKEMLLRGPENITGPILLKDAVDRYLSGDRRIVAESIRSLAGRLRAPWHGEVSRIRVLDHDAWYPIDWTNPIHQRFRREILRGQLVLGRRVARWLFPRSSIVTYWTRSWG